MTVKQKNFRLPLELCEKLDADERTATEVVIGALRREYGIREVVEVPREDFDGRVAQLAKTLDAETATRIAILEML